MYWLFQQSFPSQTKFLFIFISVEPWENMFGRLVSAILNEENREGMSSTQLVS